MPVSGLPDKALRGRLSAMGATVQLGVALLEPLVLTAGIVIGGIVLLALTRRIRALAFARTTR